MLLIKYRKDQIKNEEMGGACSIHENMNNAYKIFIGKSNVVVNRHWKPEHK
jgi:hypothetical protein